MRAGEGVDLVARCFERRTQESDGRALAVRPGDVKNRRQLVLRPSETVEQCKDPLEPEPVARGRELGQPIELGLDARMCRAREIGHQAASFASGARYEIRSASFSFSSP